MEVMMVVGPRYCFFLIKILLKYTMCYILNLEIYLFINVLQSSWTKQAVELDSPQAASPCIQTTGHPDSTCGVVIHSDQNPTKKDFQNQEIQEGLDTHNLIFQFQILLNIIFWGCLVYIFGIYLIIKNLKCDNQFLTF